LHDGVGPSLASLNLQLLTLHKQLQPTGPELAAEIEGLAGQAQANLRDIRRLIYDLRPAVLDELGLAAALREYAAARYQREQHLDLSLEIADGSVRFPDPLEAALYRIVQEALGQCGQTCAGQRRARRAGLRRPDGAAEHCRRRVRIRAERPAGRHAPGSMEHSKAGGAVRGHV
jgi:signal transduction histidine kinase